MNIQTKIGHIFSEIVIIFIALTISFFFERWRENRADHHTEREFLTGLNQDFNDDLKELRSDSATYMLVGHSFKYLLDYDVSKNPAPDSLAKYTHWLFNTTDLIPNTSRIDALKFSGKIGVIENKVLLDNILNIYQESIPSLLTGTQAFSQFKTVELIPYYRQHIKYENGDTARQVLSILPEDQFKIYLSNGRMALRMAQNYHSVIDAIINTQALINKELK